MKLTLLSIEYLLGEDVDTIRPRCIATCALVDLNSGPPFRHRTLESGESMKLRQNHQITLVPVTQVTLSVTFLSPNSIHRIVAQDVSHNTPS